MISTLRREPGIENFADLVAWFRARPWYYAYAVLALFGVIPGLRRVIDWRSSFSSVSIVSVVPLLALVPAAVALAITPALSKLGRRPLIAAWLWSGGFAYAYAIGIVSGNAVPATYTFLGFVLPMCFGLVLGSLDVPRLDLYERIAKFALALSVPISAYAFFQYAFPPPWDLLWIQQTGLINVGVAAPFGFRPFSTLNGPGPFADFLALVITLNLPRIRGGTILRYGALALATGALALTLVRADWIALVLAGVVFAALSPRKVQNLSTLAAFALAIALFTSNAGAILGEGAGTALQTRFESFASITTDSSYLDRQVLFGNALSSAIAEPSGEGLGVVGTAAKLGAGGSTIDFDNGYIARFTEMGYFGIAAYLATLAFMIVAIFARWLAFERRGDAASSSLAAAALATQVALLFLDISGDHHAQFPGVFAWLTFAIVFVGSKTESPQEASAS